MRPTASFVLLVVNVANSAAMPQKESRSESKVLLRRDQVHTVESPSEREDGRETATLKRMQYWAEQGQAKPPTSRYVIFTNDNGGPNNLRIGWEMTGVIAQKTNRTFVLPPAEKVYLLDFGPLNGRDGLRSSNFDEATSKTKVEDLINLAQLKANLPTLTWDEFQQRTGMTFKDAVAQAGKVENTEHCPSLEKLDAIKNDILYIDGKELRQGFACGEWAELGGPEHNLRSKMDAKNWALLTHGFVWHPDVFSIASKVVNYLGLFQYNALHGRYGDLQYQDVKTEPATIFTNWPSLLQDARTLYIASDNPEKFDSVNFGNVKMLRWPDLFTQKTNFLLNDEQSKFTPERWFKLMGPIEELICTYSKVFVGTKLSTFSGHIHRMRIHAQAPTTETYKHSDKEVPGDIRQKIALWKAKELNYQGHDPNSGDIFLQMDQLD